MLEPYFSWKPLCWLHALLLIAMLQPILPANINVDRLPVRRNRSAQTDPKENLTENLNGFMVNRTFENRSGKSLQQRLQQFGELENLKASGTGSKLDAVLRNIFRVGPEQGIILFDKPTHPPVFFNPSFNPAEDIPVSLLRPDNNRPRCRPSMREGITFCSEVYNYPKLDRLAPLLNRELSVFFAEDHQPVNISIRVPGFDSEQLCESTKRIIYPKAGETKDADWLFILNDNRNFRQGVRVEECITPGRACKFADSFPNGYVATCEQNYIYRTMIALTPNGTLTQDNFKLPSCCKCELRKMR